MRFMNTKVRETARPRPVIREKVKPVEKKEIIKEVKTREIFTPKEANEVLSELEELYEKKQISQEEFKTLKEELLAKVNQPRYNPTDFDNSPQVSSYERPPIEEEERKERVVPEQRALREKEAKEKKKSVMQRISEGSETIAHLKHSGALRLIIFVILAVLLLLFVTRSGLGGFSNSAILLFLIVIVIIFIIGKGGEKNLFDRF